MVVNRAWFLRGSVAALVILFCWLVFEFSPDRQLSKAFARLISAAEDRNWDAVKELMAEDYHDQWDFNREQAIELASNVFTHFLTLQITAENPAFARTGRDAVITSRFHLRGRGNAIGEALMRRANALDDDFKFAWRRISWKPWSWKLVSVHQKEINIDPTLLP